jgi:hypothetical protein
VTALDRDLAGDKSLRDHPSLVMDSFVDITKRIDGCFGITVGMLGFPASVNAQGAQPL